MTTSEKVAYLKGLCEGMGVEDTGNGKLFKVIIDILEDLALDLADTKDSLVDLTDGVDELSEELEVLEDEFYESILPDEDEDEEDEDEDEEDDDFEDEEFDEDTAFYSVKCPGCGMELTVDEDILADGDFECPECGELIDFDSAEVKEVSFEDEDEEEE